jgi:chromosomal replication initiation ATPase DnaA
MLYDDNYTQFLDSIQAKPQINYFDVAHVLQAAHVHYYANNYQHNYPNQPTYHSLIQHNNYQHPIPKVPLLIPTKKIEINSTITSLGDIISILDKYPYNEEYEYNIDLKNLHKIRSELVQLNTMIGLSSLKTSILNQLIYFLQEPILCEKNRGYKHTILCGPPGTGKTEVAKIIGNMYSKLGVLSHIEHVAKDCTNKTHKILFKKVTRSDLVAGYLGQTAMKTKEVINDCLGGCLFIDEAYSLGTSSGNDSFSRECIDTLCESMSDHKDDLMVIIAGYENELKEHFFSVNPGLESRFIWKFTIDKYSPEEMRQILHKKILEEDWLLDIDTKTQSAWFEKNKDDFKHYGRDMEQLLLHIKVVHSRRIYGLSRDLCKKITMVDLENGHKTFLEHQNNKHKMSESLYGLYC